MEVFGGSGGRKHYVSQAQLQKLAEGGRRADNIKKLSNNHHKNFELSEAEKLIEKANKAYDEQQQKEEQQQKISHKKMKTMSLWEKIINFFKRIFYPLEK